MQSFTVALSDNVFLFERKALRTLFYACFLLYLILHTVTAQSQVQFERIGNKSVIPDNVVIDLEVDADGYLWIATAAGLVRHDGYRFKLFEHKLQDPTSIGGNFIRDINIFDDGTLWLSTELNGVSIYHPETESFSRLIPEANMKDYPGLSNASKAIRDNNGHVWIATNFGIYRVNIKGEVLGHYSTDTGMPHNRVRVILLDKQGTIWGGTGKGLVRYSIEKDIFEPIKTATPELHSFYIRSLFEADDGRIWVGTDSSGLWVYDYETDSLQVALKNQPAKFMSSTVYDIFQFNEEELWAARFGGIDRLSATNGEWLSRIVHDPSDGFSLANNDIRTLTKDKAGVIWIGGYGGGVQRAINHSSWLKNLRFSLLKENALTEPNVSSLLALKNGNIWVGTRGQGIDIVEPGKGVVGTHVPEVALPGKLHAGWITALTEFTNGDIWVGANPGQLYRYNRQSQYFSLYGVQKGFPGENVRVLRPSIKGGLWVGTNAGLHYWDHLSDRIRSFRLENGEAILDGVNALHEDKDGHLLVATGASGLYTVGAGTQYLTQLVGADEYGKSLNSISIVGMLRDSSGRLWLDTPGGLHLATFTQAGSVELENHSAKYGFGGQPMGANLLEDNAGRLWTPSFIYSPEEKYMTPLQRADGIDIGTSWYRSYTKTAQGQFLFGGSYGLAIVDPEHFEFWDYMPPLVVSELRLDGIAINAGMLQKNGLTLSHTERSFSIEFAALDLSAPLQNKYRFQLTGFDNDWVEVDATRRIASYSNLWPGEYSFAVEGTNRSGQWSDQKLTFKVNIEAAFWQTYWFMALCILFFASCIVFGFRIRTRWIKDRARELESQVQERTQALKKAQKDFIEQEKMASLGGLVAGVSHEINTPMGIALTAATGLSDDCESLESKLTGNRLKKSDLHKYFDKARSANSIILSSLERACSLMASFKQVAVDQTSEHRRQFDMKTLLDDIERSLHSMYANNGHQLLLACPEGITMDSYPGSLFQVCTNLINNSVVHGFASKENGTIRINVETSGQQLIIHYSDDGEGMTAEVKQKAFDPFFTTKFGVGGSGLGMHLVYNYVSQVLGGKISIESSPGSGFECDIEIPLVAPSNEGADK